MSRSKTVYPTGEREMPGVPMVPLSVDAATAKRLIASGAFTAEGKGDAIELTDGAMAALDLFVPPVGAGDEPADVGDESPTEPEA